MKNHFCSNPLCLAKVEKKGDLCDECEQENSYTTVYMSIEDNKKMAKE